MGGVPERLVRGDEVRTGGAGHSAGADACADGDWGEIVRAVPKALLAVVVALALCVVTLQATVLDTFTQADGALSGSWTLAEGNALTVAGNKAINHDGGGTFSMVTYTACTFADDQSSQFTVSTVGNYPIVGARWTGSAGTSSGYYAIATTGSNDITLRRRVNQSDTTLWTRTAAIANGQAFKIDVSGQNTSTVIKVFANGSQVGADETDASGSARNTGRPSMGIYNTLSDIELDDFTTTGETCVAASVPTLGLMGVGK